MTNTSATGGYLAPTVNTNLYDKAFETFLQEVIAGITGITGSLVRVQGQPIPPQLPPLDVDWCSFHPHTEKDLSIRGSVRHDPTGNGSDIFERTVQNYVLVCFYGPNAWFYASAFCDGLSIEQNRWALQSASIGIMNIGSRRSFHELVNETWLERVDIEITLNREIQKVYPVLNLLSAHGVIKANVGEKTITTNFDTDNVE